MSNFIQKVSAMIILLGLSIPTNADDIDLINNETLVGTNVLFVMDLSGSMNGDILGVNNPAVIPDPSRLDELKGAFQDIVADADFDDINFGLSVFSGVKAVGDTIGKNVAHGITYPIGPVETAQQILNRNAIYNHPGLSPYISYMPVVPTPASTTTREYLTLLSSDWVASGQTPIVGALYEAARYFKGNTTHFGRRLPDDIRSAHPSSYTGELTNGSFTPVCDVNDHNDTARIVVACGTGGPTETSGDNWGFHNSSIDTGVVNPDGIACVLNPNPSDRQTCSSVTVASGDPAPSCGLGTLCSLPTTFSSNRGCPSSEINNSAPDSFNISACQAYGITQGQTWENCVVTEVTDTASSLCVPDGEGGFDCPLKKSVRCKEWFKRKTCERTPPPPNWRCPINNGTACKKCPDAYRTVEGVATYKTPITEECPKNGIVLLSDGRPNVSASASASASSLVTGMIGSTYAGTCSAGSLDGRCGPELAGYLFGEDHASTVTGHQNIQIFTVGLALGVVDPLDPEDPTTYLKNIATKGGGAFVSANDRASLTAAFKAAITSIARQARSFSAPSYSVDTTNLLSHNGFVYVPVFDRGAIIWSGNLKKFKIINGVLSDKDNNPAADASGALLSTAKDYWATTASTDPVLSGGAANMIDPATRKIFTDNDIIGTGANLQTLDDSVSKVLLGDAGMTNTYRTNLINYIRGENADGSNRKHMGDIIHSKPVQLDIAGGRKVIFVGSNEGYLHAINDADGTEAFSFMPAKLLKNIDKQYSSMITNKHTYGVDGPITLWIDEGSSSGSAVGNEILDAGEKAYLFFGLRRGGSSYYALEITDPDNPVLKWRIANSANSWSQPVIAHLQYKNGENGLNSISAAAPVLVIGGGYTEDSSGVEDSTVGNEVFIIDIASGKQIWSTKVAESGAAILAPDDIDNPVPGRVRVLDVDRNGSIDRLYFGDTGGRIWRVDLNAKVTDRFDISKARLHMFADLGDRKFFEEPDVAVFNHHGRYVATVAIGSGDRTKPITVPTTDNHFFVLYDKEILTLPTINEMTLTDLDTAPLAPATNILDPSFYGWYKTLTSTTGEKVLASALTFQGKVMFTTFGTTSVTPDACNPSNVNQSRLYIMDLLAGELDSNTAETSGEILGTPQVFFDKLQAKDGSACVKGDCVRPVKIRVGRVGPIDLPPPHSLGSSPSLPDAFERVYWLDDEQ